MILGDYLILAGILCLIYFCLKLYLMVFKYRNNIKDYRNAYLKDINALRTQLKAARDLNKQLTSEKIVWQKQGIDTAEIIKQYQSQIIELKHTITAKEIELAHFYCANDNIKTFEKIPTKKEFPYNHELQNTRPEHRKQEVI